MLKKLLERISIPTPKHLKPESKQRRLMRRYLAVVLCGCMMVPTIGSIAMATDDMASVCPNHQAHDENCGYDANGICGHVCPECTITAGAQEEVPSEEPQEPEETQDDNGTDVENNNTDDAEIKDSDNISSDTETGEADTPDNIDTGADGETSEDGKPAAPSIIQIKPDDSYKPETLTIPNAPQRTIFALAEGAENPYDLEYFTSGVSVDDYSYKSNSYQPDVEVQKIVEKIKQGENTTETEVYSFENPVENFKLTPQAAAAYTITYHAYVDVINPDENLSQEEGISPAAEEESQLKVRLAEGVFTQEVTVLSRGDGVSSFADLQAKISNGEKSIVLTKDIDGGSTALTIPADKGVTLNLNGHTLTISSAKKSDGQQDNAINVKGTLTIIDIPDSENDPGEAGQGQIIGKEIDNAINIETKGTLNLQGGKITTTSSNRAIFISENALFNMSDGVISENKNQVAKGGGVFVNGGTMEMTGGAILDNAAIDTVSAWGAQTVAQGGGIYVQNNGRLTVSGGKIAGNTATNGGGICINDGCTVNMNGGQISGNTAAQNGGGIYGKNNATGEITINMSGGTISGNTATNGGGGIFLQWSEGWPKSDNNELNLSGGKISNNTAKTQGGGIYTTGNFTMTGGTITGNIAEEHEGGGIFYFGLASQDKQGQITGGTISNNQTNTKVDLGGGGIFVNKDAKMYIKNALITGNTADGLGGGVAGCIHGENSLLNVNGAAIFENTANNSDDAHSQKLGSAESEYYADGYEIWKNFQSKLGSFEDYFCAGDTKVYDKMLGGGSENWSGYNDKNPEEFAVETVWPENGFYHGVVILGADPTETAKDKAEKAAKVFIQGNTSSIHGGGVGCNGVLIFGEEDSRINIYDELKLQAKKQYQDDKGNPLSLEEGQVFKFSLYASDDGGETVKTELAAATNDADGNIQFKAVSLQDIMNIQTAQNNTYTLYMKEVKGDINGVEYDDTVYTITITTEKAEESANTTHHKIIGIAVSPELKAPTTPEGDSQTEAADSADYNGKTPTGWIVTKDTPATWSNGDDFFTFTNTVKCTELSVKKEWSDISSDAVKDLKIHVQLYYEKQKTWNGYPLVNQDNEPVYEKPVEYKTAEKAVDADGKWQCAFENLPSHDAKTGAAYRYSIKETGITSTDEFASLRNFINEQRNAVGASEVKTLYQKNDEEKYQPVVEKLTFDDTGYCEIFSSTGEKLGAFASAAKAGENTSIALTNTWSTGAYEFSVYKVDEENPKKYLPGATFTLSKDGEVIRTQTTPEAGTVTFKYLEADTYTLTETKAPENYQAVSTTWTVTIDDKGTVTITDSAGNAVGSDWSSTDKTLTVKNKPVKGKLTITKQLKDAAGNSILADEDKTFTFKIARNMPVPIAESSLDEQNQDANRENPTNLPALADPLPGLAATTVTEGDTEDTGADADETVTDEATPIPWHEAEDGEMEVSVTVKKGDSEGVITVINMPCDDYTIEEVPKDTVFGYTWSKVAFDGAVTPIEENKVLFTIQSANNTTPAIEITATNTYTENEKPKSPAPLTISKTVVDQNNQAIAGDTTPFQFTVTFAAGTDLTNARVKVADQEGTAVELNAENPLVFTLTHGQQAVISGLLIGTKYTVTEKNANGYTLDKVDVLTGATVSQTNLVEGTISENAATVAFTNKKTPETGSEFGNLLISKVVSGNRSSTQRDFTFTLTLRNTDGTPYTGVYTRNNGVQGNITNGTATFLLRHGESVSVSGLPIGTTYTVTENAEDYSATITDGNGNTISGSGTITVGANTVAFDNYRSGGGGGGRRPTPDTEIDEPPTPQVYYPGEEPDPNEPDSPEEITIMEEDVPQTYIKTWDPENEEYVYLPEEPIPLAPMTSTPTPLARLDTTPKTDDPNHPWFWLGICFASALGIGLLKPRKKQEDE